MKKIELEALGLDREQIRAVQKIHGADIERERNRPASRTNDLIHAILAVVRLLPPENLNELLVHAATLYNKAALTSNMTTAAAPEPQDQAQIQVKEAADVED